MAEKKYYVVWVGKQAGVFTSWAECQAMTSGVAGAKYKSYSSKADAERAYKEGWKKHWGQSAGSKSGTAGSAGVGKPSTAAKRRTSSAGATSADSAAEIDYDSISVDVGTRGNPGPIEYKGVDTRTGEILFYVGPVPNGTNNLGEFIAIVHALAYLKQQGSTKTVYTDSRTALSWLKKKSAVSTLVKNESTKQIWEMTERAERWLQNNTYKNKVIKWETEKWGEIKADFGRK
ncbi:ribonuclease H [Paenibacillaceae bacterium]|nr:ribonuclease H [Paenibacillaceae bacterium]